MIVSDAVRDERKKLLTEVLRGTIALSHPEVMKRLHIPQDSPDFISIGRPIFEDRVMLKPPSVLTYRPRKSPYAPVIFEVVFPMPNVKHKFYAYGVVAHIEAEWRPVSPSSFSFTRRRQAQHQYLRIVR